MPLDIRRNPPESSKASRNWSTLGVLVIGFASKVVEEVRVPDIEDAEGIACVGLGGPTTMGSEAEPWTDAQPRSKNYSEQKKVIETSRLT